MMDLLIGAAWVPAGEGEGEVYPLHPDGVGGGQQRS